MENKGSRVAAHRTSVRWAALLVAVAVGGACGGSSGGAVASDAGTPVAANSVAISDWPKDVAQVRCGKIFDCCASAVQTKAGGTVTACQDGFTTKLTQQGATMQSELDQGMVVYHGETAATCLARFRAATCSQLETDPLAVESCSGYLEPKVAVGGACQWSEACVAGYCAAGKCAALKAQGESCMNNDECGTDNCENMKCAPAGQIPGFCEQG